LIKSRYILGLLIAALLSCGLGTGPVFAAPKKVSRCMAHLVAVSKSQLFGVANTTTVTIKSFRSFRKNTLKHDNIDASNVGTMNLTDKNILPSIRKRLAGRIRLLERHNLGELKIDFISGVQFEGRENIEEYLNGILEYSKRLDQNISPQRFGNYLFYTQTDRF